MTRVARPTQLSLLAPTRFCCICGLDLPLDLFMPRKDRPGRYHSGCRSCINARQNARYVPHPLPPLPSEKKCGGCGVNLRLDAFAPRGDRARGVRSQCRECRRAEKRRYDETHAEQRRESSRRYYEANARAVTARIKACIAANPEKYREIHRVWKQRNKDAVNASTHKRRARLRHNGGTWTANDWERLKARYDWRCLMCGKQEATDGIHLCFDHVVPLSLGGFNIISNGQPLCRSCNSLKHRKVLDLRPDF